MPRDIFRLAYDVRMQTEGSDTAELMLYGEIVQDGPKWWKWSQEDKSAAEFDKAIKDIREAGATKLLLRINSPGGVCTESVAMRSILSNAGFDEINIRIEGMCASAATDIATLPGAHVAIAEGSEYMIHNPWCGVYGNASELEHTAQRLRNIEKISRGFYTKRTGQTDEKVKEWMDAETWFTAEEAVENGFCDEVLTAEAQSETPAAACVSSRVMATMRDLYKAIPSQIAEKPAEPSATNPVSSVAQVARLETQWVSKSPTATSGGRIRDSNAAPRATTEIHHHEEETNTMDIKNANVDQLRAENPALFEQIQQNAVTAERQRQDDIDALTIPGYEEMAAQAKQNGTSAMDFHKQLTAAMKQKGPNFMQQRKAETAPAQTVPGGVPDNGADSEEKIIEANAKAIAEYAKQYSSNGGSGMY